MARLNEPPVSAESMETLRRKFLRQNRDIARVNSNQSLRIRCLENDCARLLSENLELRGQILRLENEVENSPSRRIADHALEIRSRLESQLLEWSELLGGLGLEPPMKRHSPATRRRTTMASPRTSLSRSPALRRPRDLARDSESLAMQEGRLPPIYENKSYPRQTMNTEEILALCSEAEDSTDSPNLGPPPTSRFVDDDPVKTDSPSRPGAIRVYSESSPLLVADAPSMPPGETSPTPPAAVAPRKKTVDPPQQPKKEASPLPSTVREQPLPVQKSTTSPSFAPGLVPASVAAPTPAAPVVIAAKSGSKRKFGVSDENEGPSIPKGNNASSGLKTTTTVIDRSASENRASLKEIRNKRGIKELARREGREKASGAARPALAAKSTNEDVTSPKKQLAKNPNADAGRPSLKLTTTAALLAKEGHGKERAREPRVPRTAIDVPEPAHKPLSSVVVVTTEPGPNPTRSAASLEGAAAGEQRLLLSPSPVAAPDATPRRQPSPSAAAAAVEICDTPPPRDISSAGDTARASRRARAAVSYAEPNLRDKMRRPTKELFDAVSGEGKYKHRTSSAHREDPSALGCGASSVPSSATKLDRGGGASAAPEEAAAAKAVVAPPPPLALASEERNRSVGEASCRGRDGAISPSAQKRSPTHGEDLPTDANVNLASRRKVVASSAAAGEDGLAAMENMKALSSSLKNRAAAAAAAAAGAATTIEVKGPDPYEFTTDSPALAAMRAGVASHPSRAGTANLGLRHHRRPQSTTAAPKEGQEGEDEQQQQPQQQHRPGRPAKSESSKKRASMVVPKKSSMLDDIGERSDDEYVDDSSSSFVVAAAKGRSLRRRSMML